MLGGQLVTPFAQIRPPFWVWNAGMNQLYCSAYHLAPQNVAAYLDAIRQHKLVYLLGYPSALHALAQMAIEQNLEAPQLKAIISNAEPLYAHQRQVISQAFNCPVYDTYGQSENVCAASECLHGRLHLWPELGQTEILRDENAEAAPLGETGRLVCTGLLNLSMPLIRYEVGDRASFSSFSPENSCPCGRTLPTLGSIEGRSDDVLLTRDGRRIGRLDPVFKADLPVREAQIIQETRERVTVRYVPAPGCTPGALNGLAARLRERLGDVDVRFEAVTEIPRSANGKFRAVISKCR
jgi:phenylacetate-CoA ligase